MNNNHPQLFSHPIESQKNGFVFTFSVTLATFQRIMKPDQRVKSLYNFNISKMLEVNCFPILIHNMPRSIILFTMSAVP